MRLNVDGVGETLVKSRTCNCNWLEPNIGITEFNSASLSGLDDADGVAGLMGPAERDRVVVVESNGTAADGLLPRRVAVVNKWANWPGIDDCDVLGVAMRTRERRGTLFG